MSVLFSLVQFVVRTRSTGAAIEGATVRVFFDNGSGGKGALVNTDIFDASGNFVDQVLTPFETDSNGVVRFRARAGLYFIEAEHNFEIFERPGFQIGRAQSRDTGIDASPDRLVSAEEIPEVISELDDEPFLAALFGLSGDDLEDPENGGLILVTEFSRGRVRAALRLLIDLLPDREDNAGKVLAVAANEEALEWVDLPSGGGGGVEELPPVAGNAGRVLGVNDAGDGVEWQPRIRRVPLVQIDFSGLTLTEGNAQTILEKTGAGATVFELPDDADEDIPTGLLFTIVRIGTGGTVIEAPTDDITLNGVQAGVFTISNQYGAATLYKRGPNEWVVTGGIE